jgi:3-phosphoshikimate 1-carboxyvinyltransferase
VEEAPDGFVVRKTAGYRARQYSIEPDASSASYPFAIAAVLGGSITVPDLGPFALQGDYAFVEVLEKLGAKVTRDFLSTTVHGGGRVFGVDVDMHDISDTVMTLAAVAPLAETATRIRNIANIRIKETDRLAAIATELERLGQRVRTGDDFIEIEPRPLKAEMVRTYDDHRMAMSFAVLAVARGGIAIENPACVAKTYPAFWDDIRACYRAAGASVPF